MEELDEFEVLWPEYYAGHAHADDDHKPLPSVQSPATSWQRRAAGSRPVDVPPSRAAVLLLRWKDGTDHQDDLMEKDGGGGKIMVPPHLLVSGRRLSDGEAAAAYTLLRSGVARHGKRARDLRHLRNSVLRMTGFIEG
ncbi:hypothetical protein CFC21_008382 [Triticum aestivum]|uniref:Uncharacterized protein n=3 Tax=Triticum TaxID=4564 RepID=A0A9R0VDT6_TRITD|nr:uncharacterized protein LOC119349145 [Triticum dicoccoides]KAF6991280.1 hypothetical protein CFC21_008382 [Triticum aestivum]VAH21636.1 unnamed protein product [Triticum turgidum subsp. durum]